MSNIIFIFVKVLNLIIKLILMVFKYVFMYDFEDDCYDYNNIYDSYFCI